MEPKLSNQFTFEISTELIEAYFEWLANPKGTHMNSMPWPIPSNDIERPKDNIAWISLRFPYVKPTR